MAVCDCRNGLSAVVCLSSNSNSNFGSNQPTVSDLFLSLSLSLTCHCHIWRFSVFQFVLTAVSAPSIGLGCRFVQSALTLIHTELIILFATSLVNYLSFVVGYGLVFGCLLHPAPSFINDTLDTERWPTSTVFFSVFGAFEIECRYSFVCPHQKRGCWAFNLLSRHKFKSLSLAAMIVTRHCDVTLYLPPIHQSLESSNNALILVKVSHTQKCKQRIRVSYALYPKIKLFYYLSKVVPVFQSTKC